MSSLLLTKIPVPYAACIIIASAGLLFYLIISSTPITLDQALGNIKYNRSAPIYLDYFDYNVDNSMHQQSFNNNPSPNNNPPRNYNYEPPPESPSNYNYNSGNIVNDWFCVFEALFINTKLKHTFHSRYHTSQPNIHIINCKPVNFDKLITYTPTYIHSLTITNNDNQTEQQSSTELTYHKFTQLRRIIMLLQHHSNDILKISDVQYIRIINLIAEKEQKYIDDYRNYYTVFMIHPPRSAGTSTCSWFRNVEYAQKRMSPAQLGKQRKVKRNAEPHRNCNLGEEGMVCCTCTCLYVMLFSNWFKSQR